MNFCNTSLFSTFRMTQQVIRSVTGVTGVTRRSVTVFLVTFRPFVAQWCELVSGWLPGHLAGCYGDV